jgi:four helix bundle protein
MKSCESLWIVHDGNSKPYDLKERTFLFAQRILEICKKLPRSPECDIIRKQMIRSGTSIGANMEEADGTSTKGDFCHMLGISRKEARETRYWLRLLSGIYVPADKIAKDIQEINEIISILSAIINKCRYRKDNKS